MAARIHQSLAKAKQRDSVIAVFELHPTARAPWGRCLEVLDVALRCGVPRIVLFGVNIPPKNADLRKLVRKLKEPSVKSRASFAIRFGGDALEAAGKRVPIPIPKRVRGAYAGFFKPEHVEIRWEEAEEEDEPEDEEIEPEDVVEQTRADLGLAWLAKQQREDGSWQGGVDATAMATLAFLTVGSERHAVVVKDGLRALDDKERSSLLSTTVRLIGFGDDAGPQVMKTAHALLKLIVGTELDRKRIESRLKYPRDWLGTTLELSARGGEDWKRWRVPLGKMLATQGRDGCWASDVTKTATMVLCAISYETNKPFLKSR